MSVQETSTSDGAIGYARYCRPKLVRLLEAFSLDAVYERAEGNYLWQRRSDDLVEILDLIGGFGANLLGHYHPALVREEARLTEARVPIQAQGSLRTGAGRLAAALRRHVGDYNVIFTNSGTETVEAALKHAFLERSLPLFWAVEGAFHGKTLGAIQLTEGYRKPYLALGPPVLFLDPENPETWSAAAAQADRTCAAVIEPIRGEGGVRPLPGQFVEWLIRTCAAARIPIIADEIQTGMGRTGTFLASTAIGLDPDYICLSKALGGGLAKVGALLIKRDRAVEEFSVAHTSTFAEDDRSCLVALKTLEILERDDLMARCAASGEYLIDRLENLRLRYPEQIKEVRGKGLLIGIELHDHADSPSNVLRMLSAQEYLGYLVAAYLLNEHRIRVAPTLSQPFTIRVEPSAYITEAELDRFVEALGLCCEALQAGDAGHLTSFQVGLGAPPIERPRPARVYKRETAQTGNRVAFLGHLILPEHAAHWDSSLARLGARDLERYMAKPSRVLGPAIFDRMHVHSPTGDVVHLSYVGLDLTPQQVTEAMVARDTGWIMEKIEDAVVLARDAGCRVLGLGGYTSIVSANCCRVKGRGVALTSGNALTVGMGAAALKDAAARTGIDVSQATLGIVGATGNIGTAYAQVMAPHVAELLLIVRDAAAPRVRMVQDAILKVAPQVRIRAATELEALRDCSLIVASSNAPGALIYPEHLHDGAVVISDISLPSDVSPAVSVERPRTTIIHGGIVRLPCDDDFAIAGLPLESGFVYACLAETLLMGLDGRWQQGSIGAIAPESVQNAMAAADRHGFTLGQYATQWAY